MSKDVKEVRASSGGLRKKRVPGRRNSKGKGSEVGLREGTVHALQGVSHIIPITLTKSIKQMRKLSSERGQGHTPMNGGAGILSGVWCHSQLLLRSLTIGQASGRQEETEALPSLEVLPWSLSHWPQRPGHLASRTASTVLLVKDGTGLWSRTCQVLT